MGFLYCAFICGLEEKSGVLALLTLMRSVVKNVQEDMQLTPGHSDFNISRV